MMRFAKVGGSRWSRLVLVGVLLSSFGCVTKIPPSDGGPYDESASIDLDLAANALMNRMLMSHCYAKEYDSAKSARGEKLPLATIYVIDPLLEGVRIQDHLDLVGEDVRVALRNSEKFDVKEDGDVPKAIVDLIVKYADGGLGQDCFDDIMGTHELPDFLVMGDLKAVNNRKYRYRLRLALHSVRTGKILWEGIENVVDL